MMERKKKDKKDGKKYEYIRERIWRKKDKRKRYSILLICDN